MRRRDVPPWLVDTVLVALAAGDVCVNADASSPLALTAGAAAAAALAARRRHPLAVFAATLPGALLMEAVVAPITALFTLAARSRDRRLLAGCAVLAALAFAAPKPLDDGFEDYHAWTLVYFGYLLATALAPVLVGQLLQARKDLSLRLAEIEEAREHERVLHAQAVLARERSQLAREMHDVVSHQVSLIAVRAAALQVGATDADTQEAARTIRGLSVDTLDELRHMVTLLRASGGRTTELTPQPTLADLHTLVANSGLDATVTGELPDTVAKTAQRAVYRTVQEALTNVRKHAPGATATVELWATDDAFGVTVANTPGTRPALPLPGSGQGLVGLRERAELLHGTLTAGPLPDGGYRVALRLPG